MLWYMIASRLSQARIVTHTQACVCQYRKCLYIHTYINTLIKKWAYFTIREKSWNSMPFLLIIAEASKQQKENSTEGFHGNIKALGCFLSMIFCVHSIRVYPAIFGLSLLWTTSVVHDVNCITFLHAWPTYIHTDS